MVTFHIPRSSSRVPVAVSTPPQTHFSGWETASKGKLSNRPFVSVVASPLAHKIWTKEEDSASSASVCFRLDHHSLPDEWNVLRAEHPHRKPDENGVSGGHTAGDRVRVPYWLGERELSARENPHMGTNPMKYPNRRKILKTLGGTGVLLATGAGTATATGRRGASGDDTLVDVAVAAGDFDILVAAVQEAGLVDALSGKRQLTVFAPTDEAFEALAEELDVEVEDLLNLDDLADILLYHVTPGRRYSESVVNAPRLPTLNGAKIDVDGTVLNDGQAEIVATDIEASNGVIHVIDGVLLP